MKALSVRKPWAWLIVSGSKDIENRTWPPPKTMGLPQRIYIHVPVTHADDSMTWLMDHGCDPMYALMMHSDLYATRAIIGEVTVVDCVTESDSAWFSGPYGWVLEDAVEYPDPIPCRGAQKLWTPPDDVLAQVREAEVVA